MAIAARQGFALQAGGELGRAGIKTVAAAGRLIGAAKILVRGAGGEQRQRSPQEQRTQGKLQHGRYQMRRASWSPRSAIPRNRRRAADPSIQPSPTAAAMPCSLSAKLDRSAPLTDATSPLRRSMTAYSSRVTLRSRR